MDQHEGRRVEASGHERRHLNASEAHPLERVLEASGRGTFEQGLEQQGLFDAAPHDNSALSKGLDPRKPARVDGGPRRRIRADLGIGAARGLLDHTGGSAHDDVTPVTVDVETEARPGYVL